MYPPDGQLLAAPKQFFEGGGGGTALSGYSQLCTVPTFGCGLYVAVKEQWWGCDILCYWLAFCWGLFCCSEQGTISQVQQLTFAQYIFCFSFVLGSIYVVLAGVFRSLVIYIYVHISSIQSTDFQFIKGLGWEMFVFVLVGRWGFRGGFKI